MDHHPEGFSSRTEAIGTQSAMIRINPFPILLNNLSNELEDKDLQSLKNVCGEFIPGGQREKIKIGWDVFNILLRQNVIGSEPEKIANLLAIIKELRRRDLVHMIKKHIQQHYEQPEMILNYVRGSDSMSGPKIAYSSNRIQSDEQGSTSACCVQDCCCCKLTCYSSPCCGLPCCCVVLAILFAFFTVAAILAWYTDIPEVTPYLNSKDDLRKAGPFVIGVLTLFVLFVLCFSFCRIYLLRRNDRPDLGELSCSQDNGSINDQAICRPGSFSASNSGFNTPDLARAESFSSNPATASCSLSSIASRIPRVSESETTPDGLLKTEDDNVVFFTPKSSRNVSYADPRPILESETE